MKELAKADVLVNEYKPAGNYEIDWKPSNIAAGFIFISFAPEICKTKKMTFVR